MTNEFLLSVNLLTLTLQKQIQNKTNKKTGNKCTMPPDFVIPRGLSTVYRCSLTNLAQDKPSHEKPINQRLLQPQRESFSVTLFTKEVVTTPL